VIVTMIAALTFDTRLLWPDTLQQPAFDQRDATA